MLLIWIIVFSILGSIGAIAGAAVMLLFPAGTRRTLLPCLLSYATGTLLGAAFLGMIPHALQQAAPLAISGTVLAGIQRVLHCTIHESRWCGSRYSSIA